MLVAVTGTVAMRILSYLTVLASTAILFLGLAVDCAMSAQTLEPAFVLSAEKAEGGGLRLIWSIERGSYLYRDKITISGSDGQSIPLRLPAGEMKDDPNFGPTEIYRHRTIATLDRSAFQDESALLVTFQGCADRGICYPPETAKVDAMTLQVGADRPGTDSAATPSASTDTWQAGAPPGGTSLTLSLAAPSALSGSWTGLGITFLGLGLLLAFTPCVLPMVPILVGMLSRSAGGLTSLRGFILSSVYVLAMAAAYGVLGIAAAWSGQNLQNLLQAPAALAVMAAVFVGLALASFGLFELRLPAGLTDKMAGRLGSRSGPVAGAAALGFTSALIVGPCVTPPLAAALIYVGQTGDVARGAFALFALGLGMGLPLVAVGTFGARILPRSGAWLLLANRAFGFVFLAIAVALLGRVLPPQATMALWAALAVGAGVFAGAFDPVAASDGTVPRLRKSAGLLAVIYGGTLVVGMAAGADDPLRPLAFAKRQQVAAAVSAVTTVRSVAELDAALATARGETRPVLVEFSAEWCTSCKAMERDVFANPAVRDRLRSLRVIRADVTRTGMDSAALMRRFGVVGPPTLVFLNPRDGREIAAARSTGEISVDEFRRVLDRVQA